MAAKDRFGKAGRAARQNPYLKHLIEDEEARAHLLSAYAAARNAYGRMSNGKHPTQALFDDRRLQRDLGLAMYELREAASSLREPPKRSRKRRRGGVGRSLLVLAVASVLALALSEDLRTKLLDLMFGAEEEFDYSSTTTPATPPPATVASS